MDDFYGNNGKPAPYPLLRDAARQGRGHTDDGAGSIAKCRDKGGVIFADLRDTTGILQLIFDDSTDRAVFEKASGLEKRVCRYCRGHAA